MTDNNYSIKTPAHWTGIEALRVCGFLESLVDAIWRDHSDAMSHQLAIDAALEEYTSSVELYDSSVEEIPW